MAGRPSAFQSAKARGEGRRGARTALHLLAGGAVALALVGIGAQSASAHPGPGDGKAHAEQDLVGVPVTQLEKTAKPLAGRRTVTPSARAAVAEAAGQQGTWSPVTNTGVVPLFTAVLPNGKVLMWDSVGDGPTESYPNHTFTRALVYDPATGTQTRVDLSGSNTFCAGFVQLADGRVFIAGGNRDSALNGTNLTHIFDWNTNTWTRGPNMSGARWYPSVAALMDDQALVVGGGPATADLRQTDGAVRALSGVTAPATRDYPHIQSQPGGRTLYTGPESLMRLWSVQGSGTTTTTGNRDSGYRGYSSYAQYRPGLTLVSGGSGSPQPLASSVIVDRRDVTTKVSAGASMANPRMQHNLTVLPDGSLLATGGLSRLGDNNNGLVSLANPVYAAERWSPETNAWSTWASAVVPRQYHSTATLLPDGRILTGGGGICGECQRVGYLQENIEIFTPPYLYAKDGSGALAARPSVSGVPARGARRCALHVHVAAGGSDREGRTDPARGGDAQRGPGAAVWAVVVHAVGFDADGGRASEHGAGAGWVLHARGRGCGRCAGGVADRQGRPAGCVYGDEPWRANVRSGGGAGCWMVVLVG